jgi:murein DD-endopeptidase MepM/ murein hydrolase activator NlpD
VSEGDQVDPSTVIGAVGTTGNASGPHLHFEIRGTDGNTLDPLSVLEKDELLSAVH